MTRIIVLLLAVSGCGPSSTAPFKPLGQLFLAPNQQQDANGIFGLVANDDHVVVGLRDGRLLVYDDTFKISATAAPESLAVGQVFVGETKGFGCLAISGTTVYAGLAGNTLKVVSLADPKNPVITATVGIIPGSVVATMNSHYLFVSSGVRTQAIDISVSPPVAVTPELPLTSVLSLAASETHLYSTDTGRAAINAWTISDKGVAMLEQRISVSTPISALGLRGNMLAAANSGVLALFDVSTPETPKPINAKPGVVLHTQDWNLGEPDQAVAFMGSTQLIAPGYGPVVYDLTKPETVEGRADGLARGLGDLELQAYAAATRTRFWTAGNFSMFGFGRE
jgi:hypothetical protein